MEQPERDAERLQILGDLRGEVMVFQPIAIRQISRNGAQVETEFPFHLNSLHEFRLSLRESSVVVTGRVVHCHISDVDQEIVRYLSGIEFVEMTFHAGAAIAEFVQAIKDSRQGYP